MKNKSLHRILLCAASASLMLSNLSKAADYWWDSNAATAGFGNTTGIWGTSAFWSTSNAGTATSTAATINSSDVVNFGTATLSYANGAVGIVAGGVTVNSIVYGTGQTGSSFTAMPGLDVTNAVTWTMDAAYVGTYEVQTSLYLGTWTNVVPRPVPVSGNLSYMLPNGLGKRFVRLLVTPTP